MRKLIPLALIAAIGCAGGAPLAQAPETVPVKGKVILSSGSPLTTGRIVFVPEDKSKQEAVGGIGKDGTFTLTSYKQGDGAATGNYTIKIEDGPPTLPKKYTTGGYGSVTVEKGKTDYTIRLN